MLYDAQMLGEKVGFTVAEDEAFATNAMGRQPIRQTRKGRVITLSAARFPQRLIPAGETKVQAKQRRAPFTRRKRKETTMQLQLATGTNKPAPTVTRLQSLLNVLPAPPGRTTIPAAASELRLRWRDAAGKPRNIRSIENIIRVLREAHPEDIGSELVSPGPGKPAMWLLWRRPS